MDKRAIERLVKEAVSLGKKALAEPDAKEILKYCSVPVPKFQIVKDVSNAVEAAGKIGYPLVLKIVSPDIIHKSDMGGVALGITDARDIELQWSTMILSVADECPTAMIEGFLLEEMVPMGVEVIVGAIKDEQFGTYVMFGTGGVAVELMKDVSFRLGPIGKDEALEMMREVAGFPLLTGFRGSAYKDIEAVADVIVKLSRTVEEIDGLKELEINPLMVYENGVIAVDARAVLG
ncbi:MAG: acetate--CoA ligase family protein [Deltaproteobacteria bacterium]|nr:acetate--CoA ligase family protein [Deltaproteobacteria bacterium]MBI5810146.1 acetate--CoA ligase family protein [Deltaproteobacteria bacterium]